MCLANFFILPLSRRRANSKKFEKNFIFKLFSVPSPFTVGAGEQLFEKTTIGSGLYHPFIISPPSFFTLSLFPHFSRPQQMGKCFTIVSVKSPMHYSEQALKFKIESSFFVSNEKSLLLFSIIELCIEEFILKVCNHVHLPSREQLCTFFAAFTKPDYLWQWKLSFPFHSCTFYSFSSFHLIAAHIHHIFHCLSSVSFPAHDYVSLFFASVCLFVCFEFFLCLSQGKTFPLLSFSNFSSFDFFFLLNL